MARITVEDCLKNVKNRFELVIIAAKRARQLMRGKQPKVEIDNDKPTVLALREIAAGFTVFDTKETPRELREHDMELAHTETESETTITIEEKIESADIDQTKDNASNASQSSSTEQE